MLRGKKKKILFVLPALVIISLLVLFFVINRDDTVQTAISSEDQVFNGIKEIADKNISDVTDQDFVFLASYYRRKGDYEKALSYLNKIDPNTSAEEDVIEKYEQTLQIMSGKKDKDAYKKVVAAYKKISEDRNNDQLRKASAYLTDKYIDGLFSYEPDYEGEIIP